MIYDTYNGFWWKCNICGEISDQTRGRYPTGTSAMRALKKHNKTHTKEKKQCQIVRTTS